MFLCHLAPLSRSSSVGSWVEPGEGKAHDHCWHLGCILPRVPAIIVRAGEPIEATVKSVHDVDCDPELIQRRQQLPLNGETAFADTAAAFAALPPAEQALLERTRVRRRVNPEDVGYLAPLVRANARTGVRSLHSPVYDARPGIRPPIEVEGMGREEGRLFLDRLEKHCLSPEFRYDHAHSPGDVTICKSHASCFRPLWPNRPRIAISRNRCVGRGSVLDAALHPAAAPGQRLSGRRAPALPPLLQGRALRSETLPRVPCLPTLLFGPDACGLCLVVQ